MGVVGVNQPFFRLWATRLVEGNTTVEWEIDRRFRDPGPLTFSLQAAPTSTPAETDWTDVGPAAVNASMLVDDDKRAYGIRDDFFYRVKLQSALGSYASPPTAVGLIPRHDYLNYREMLRQLRKRARKFTGISGWLLRQRRYGTECQTCLDPITREPSRSDCPECKGTGYSQGYHAAWPILLYATKSLTKVRTRVDPELSRGTVDPTVCMWDLHGFPQTCERDLFVEKNTDKRWRIEGTSATADVRGMPLAQTVEMRVLPYSDPEYKIDLRLGS